MNKVFKALNDPVRRDILKMLRKKDMTAGEIAARFSMTAPSISHHLDKLKQADLVSSVKRGQYVLYSSNSTVIEDLLAYLLKLKK
jgi:Predicted transcriptional regulators